jgi:hypothetical protein
MGIFTAYPPDLTNVSSSIATKYKTRLEVTKVLSYNKAASITSVKSFIILVQGVFQ